MSDRPRLGSLFSGIGGFELGFERAGFDVRWQVEIGAFPTRVLERHWPDVRRYRDVHEVDPAALEPVDVVTFGSPCQDLSVAGRRAGLHGERSGLFYEACRIIRGLRPAYVVFENVPGALSSRGGRDFAAILDALADSGCVELAWACLDSRFYGVPQRRRRLFVVGRLGNGPSPRAIFAECTGRRRHPAPRPEAGAGLAGGPSGGAGSGGWTEFLSQSSRVYRDDQPAPALQGVGTHQGKRVAAVLTTKALTARQTRLAGEDTYVPVTSPALRAEGHDASEDGNGRRALIAYGVSEAPTPKVGEDVMPTFGANHGGGGRRDAIAFAWHRTNPGTTVGESSPTLTDSGGHLPAVAFTNRSTVDDAGAAERLRSASHGALPMVAYGFRHGASIADNGQPQRELSPARSAGDSSGNAIAFGEEQGGHVYENPVTVLRLANGHAGAGPTVRTPDLTDALAAGDEHGSGGRQMGVHVGTAVRRLTPTEAERLQGFPDGFTCLCGVEPYSTAACRCPDSPRYSALGNAVTVNVALWLAVRLAALLTETPMTDVTPAMSTTMTQ